MMTKRDTVLRILRDRGAPEVEVRAALCHVTALCRSRGVERIRDVVLDDEPVFYVDDDLRESA